MADGVAEAPELVASPFSKEQKKKKKVRFEEELKKRKKGDSEEPGKKKKKVKLVDPGEDVLLSVVSPSSTKQKEKKKVSFEEPERRKKGNSEELGKTTKKKKVKLEEPHEYALFSVIRPPSKEQRKKKKVRLEELKMKTKEKGDSEEPKKNVRREEPGEEVLFSVVSPSSKGKKRKKKVRSPEELKQRKKGDSEEPRKNKKKVRFEEPVEDVREENAMHHPNELHVVKPKKKKVRLAEPVEDVLEDNAMHNQNKLEVVELQKKKREDDVEDELEENGTHHPTELQLVELENEAVRLEEPVEDVFEENAIQHTNELEIVGTKKKKKKKVRFEEAREDVLEENSALLETNLDYGDLSYDSETRSWKKDWERQDLKYGKFTHEEDDQLKTAVYNYIKMRGWGVEEGLDTVLHSSLHPDARGCWLDIARALPYRPVKQINSRASRIFGSDSRGRWSKKEKETLKDLFDIHGHDWKKIATFMDRSAQLCKDRWRHLRLEPTLKIGPWSQDEYDKLCKLVRISLRVKASIPAKEFDRRELRDDINWEWISEEMHRESGRCSATWYGKLASSMVREKVWSNGDDRLLLESLILLGASSEEAIDWDSLLNHRNGETCLERWMEMTRVLQTSNHASFEDKLEALAKRFTPDLMGIEEEKDSEPG